MNRFDVKMEQGTTDGDVDLDTNGLCLLSLDGGGVRGLSSLYILKKLVDDANIGRKGPAKLKPCEMFDLIAGTSTGGYGCFLRDCYHRTNLYRLIAIMLGRLEMTVDECIEHYNGMMEPVFAEKKSKFGFSRFGTTPGLNHTAKYDSKKLEDAITAAIKASDGGKGDPNAMFRETDEVEGKKFSSKPPRGCRVYVTSTLAPSPRDQALIFA